MDIRDFIIQLSEAEEGTFDPEELTPVRISMPQPGQDKAPPSTPPAPSPGSHKPDEVEVIRVGPQPEGAPGKPPKDSPKIKESEKSDTSKPKKKEKKPTEGKPEKSKEWEKIKNNQLGDEEREVEAGKRPVGKEGKPLGAPLDSHEILKRSNKQEAKEISREIMDKAEAQRKQRAEYGEGGEEEGGFLTKLRGLYKTKIDWVNQLRKKLQEFRSRTAKAIDKFGKQMADKYKRGMGKVKERSYVTGLLTPRGQSDPKLMAKGPFKKAPMNEMILIVALDVSGSMGQETLERVMSEIDKIATNFQSSSFKSIKGKVYFMAWDTSVTGTTEYTSKGWEKYYEEKEGIVGGGGTDPRVIFKYIDAHTVKDSGDKPTFGKLNLLEKPSWEKYRPHDITIPYAGGEPEITPFIVIATDGGFGKMDQAGLGELYKDKHDNVLWLIIDGEDHNVFPRNIINYEEYRV
jgi:hypothetical protein